MAVNGSKNYQRFVFYAGHDTSMMALLSGMGIWDNVWSGYASMLTIEVYNSSVPKAGPLARVVYNGVPILFPGCEMALCDVEALLKSLSFGQEAMPCSVPAVNAVPSTPETQSPSQVSATTVSTVNNGLTFGDWIGLCVTSAVLGALIASAVIIFTYKNLLFRQQPQAIEETLNTITEMVPHNSRHGLITQNS